MNMTNKDWIVFKLLKITEKIDILFFY